MEMERQIERLSKDFNEKTFILESALQRKGKTDSNHSSVKQSINFSLLNDTVNDIKASLSSIADIIKILVEDSEMCIHLSGQDEMDKRSICLMGMNDTKQIVTIDKNCLSCSEKPTRVVSAFKIACLMYHPNDVEFKGDLFSREQLLIKRKKALSLKWDTIKRAQPWNEFGELVEDLNKAPSIIRTSLYKLRESMKCGSPNKELEESITIPYNGCRNTKFSKSINGRVGTSTGFKRRHHGKKSINSLIFS